MKKLLTITMLFFVPSLVFADNIGQCGWGSKLFDGQRGIAPQVLAATTNGTSGNQTFAITSGTSGCSQDGVVKSSWRTAAFIEANMNKLARDISRGEGQTLDSLAVLMDVSQTDRSQFRTTLKDKFLNIFPNDNVNSEVVRQNLAQVLKNNAELAQYAANV